MKTSAFKRPGIRLMAVLAAAPGLMASDVVLPEWGKETVAYDPDQVKVLDEDPGLFPKDLFHVDGRVGASYMYDSNANLRRRGKGSSIGVIDFGFDISNGKEGALGGFYNFGYSGNYFSYDDPAADTGGSPLDHKLNLTMGINRAKTKFRISTAYFNNNGNSVDLERLDRETRRADSGDFSINMGVTRQLPHGSLEASTGFSSRDFAVRGLNDGRNTYGDVAWYYRPGFAPKTDLGVGVRFGSDEVEGRRDQNFVAPSFRWRYRMSAKTSIKSSIGREYRDYGNIDRGALVYSHGVTWAPSSRTTVDVTVSRSVSPSYIRGNGNYEATQVYARLSQRIGKRLTASTYVGTEDADYIQPRSGAVRRNEEFLKLGASLSHPVRLGDKLNGSATVFYNYTGNDSSNQNLEYDQHTTGVRVGFAF